MLTIKTSILLILLTSATLTSCIRKNDYHNTLSIKKESLTIKGLIPKGWKRLKQTKLADLNNDGINDIALTIAENKADFKNKEMKLRLLVILGKEKGTTKDFKVDYDIKVNLGRTPATWHSAEDRERFGITIVKSKNRNALRIHLQNTYDHDTSESSHTYEFAYNKGKMVVIGYKENSMRFNYSSTPDQKYSTVEYDFLNKTVLTKDSLNTDIPVCLSSASDAEKENCPAPLTKINKLAISKLVSLEIIKFTNFSYVEWEQNFGMKIFN